MTLSRERFSALLQQHAPLRAVPLLSSSSSLSCFHADDELPLWQALEAEAGHALPPPFYAVAWPGAQALALCVARGLLDVKGLVVVDVGAGAGLASVACARAGADVVAVDTDAYALWACALLAAWHDVTVRTSSLDVLQSPRAAMPADVVFCADLVYSQAHQRPFLDAVEVWRAAGARVVLADSGRPFFMNPGFACVFEAQVQVPRGVEGTDVRQVRVFDSAAHV
jgi:predicted nicotinamide N-methyase